MDAIMYNVIDNPPENWVRNLVEGCVIWLAKEQRMTTVVAPWEPPVGRQRTGRMFIMIDGRIDYWFVSSNGEGIDGSLLMLPIEGSLPEQPARLTSQEAQELNLEITKLRKQVEQLYYEVSVYIMNKSLM